MSRYLSLFTLLFFASQPSFAAWYCSAACQQGEDISILLSSHDKSYKYVTSQGDNPVTAFNNLITKCPGFIFNGVVPDAKKERFSSTSWNSAFTVNASLANSCVESK